MAQRRAPDRPTAEDVREVDEPTLRPLWAEAIRTEPHGKDETLVQQILEHRRDVGQVIPTQYFAAEVDGKLVAHAELYSEDGIGQVENVVTLPDYRRRGLARALVLRGVEESHAAGNELTFLVADADDWPQQLYEKLGFETVGRYARFLRPPRLEMTNGARRPRSVTSPRPRRRLCLVDHDRAAGDGLRIGRVHVGRLEDIA
jgi:ribosomal protein S18 acetylase RimI-like enzyme